MKMLSHKLIQSIRPRRFLFSSRIVNGVQSSSLKSCIYANKNDARIINRVVHPNFDSIFESSSVLEAYQSTFQKRNVAVDLFGLRNIWENLQDCSKHLESFQNKEENLVLELKQLDKTSTNYKEERERMVSEIRKLRTMMKELKNNFDEQEEILMMAMLPLPNSTVDEMTPLDHVKIVYEYKSKPSFNFPVKNHFEMGLISNLFMLSKFSPSCYLMKEAATFELNGLQWFSKNMLKASFTQFSNVGLFKPVVVEGCGLEIFNPKSVLVAQEKQNISELGRLKSYYLTGGASLPAFCSYFTRMNVRRASLPFKQFSIGRYYQPKGDYTKNGLVNSVQTTNVHFFIITENNYSKMKAEYESVLQLLKGLYETIGIHFQIVNVPIQSLENAESLRTSIRLWMPASNQYVEVAYISLCNDFISRRLMCEHVTKTTRGYLNILHGDVVNLFHFLAAIMENTQCGEKWTLPSDLKSLFGTQTKLSKF